VYQCVAVCFCVSLGTRRTKLRSLPQLRLQLSCFLVFVCCSVLQCIPVCCGVFLCVAEDEAHEAAVTAATTTATMLLDEICMYETVVTAATTTLPTLLSGVRMLQCVAVCRNVLQSVAVCCNVLQCLLPHYFVASACCSVLRCVCITQMNQSHIHTYIYVCIQDISTVGVFLPKNSLFCGCVSFFCGHIGLFCGCTGLLAGRWDLFVEIQCSFDEDGLFCGCASFFSRFERLCHLYIPCHMTWRMRIGAYVCLACSFLCEL